MPAVPDRPLSRGELYNKRHRTERNYGKHLEHTLRTPSFKKRKRAKPKDKSLFREAYDQRQHIRDIMREDF